MAVKAAAKPKAILIGTEQLCALLGVSVVTAYNLRIGKSEAFTKLPWHAIKHGTHRHRIKYKLHEVIAWAAKNFRTVDKSVLKDLSK